MVATDFREYLFPENDPRIRGFRGLNYREYAEVVKSDPFAGPMIVDWATKYPEPFRGITTDGVVPAHQLSVAPGPGEGAPTGAMVAAANHFIAALSGAQRAALTYPLRAHEWRSWANPEFLQHDTGLRLEDLDQDARDRALELVRASLSEVGFERVRTLMWINGYLGDTIGLSAIMNEGSYNIALYGNPSMTQAWGWQLFGHHLGFNCIVDGDRMVISPVFQGAEPSIILDSPLGPIDVFRERIERARCLMAGLTPAQQQVAQIYANMVDASMPPGRLHPGDERHLGGCFQDNRVIPLEGIRVDDLSPDDQDQISDLVAVFLDHLPAGALAGRLREVIGRYDESWFSWIGGWGPEDPFYFRIQSPVILLELDHHCGVFLSNRSPARFHVHTGVRTPNGGDYGGILIEAAS